MISDYNIIPDAPFRATPLFKYLDNRYDIREDGVVWSKTYNRICKTFVRHQDRVEIALVLQDDRIKKFYVDTLVASKHCPLPSVNHRCLIHIDGNNLNNHKDNLKWVTREEEMFHYYKHSDDYDWFLSIIEGACSPLPGTYSLENAKKYKYVFPLKGYEGEYTIDTYGNIFSIRGNRYSKDNIKRGYRETRVSVNNQPKTLLVHRLVALTFIPNIHPLKTPCIDHVDENKLNNHVSNLEWVSNSENSKRYNKQTKFHYSIEGSEFMPLVKTIEYVYNKCVVDKLDYTKSYIELALNKLYSGSEDKTQYIFGKYKVRKKFVKHNNPAYSFLHGKYIIKINGKEFDDIKEAANYLSSIDNKVYKDINELKYRLIDAVIQNKRNPDFKLHGKYKIELITE